MPGCYHGVFNQGKKITGAINLKLLEANPTNFLRNLKYVFYNRQSIILVWVSEQK